MAEILYAFALLLAGFYAGGVSLQIGGAYLQRADFMDIHVWLEVFGWPVALYNSIREHGRS